MKINILLLISFLMITGCGGGSSGNPSSFNDNNASPIIRTSNGNIVKNSEYPQISDDNKVYVDENRREAFKINAIDRTQLKYYIAGQDFDSFNANILTGEVVFKEPCDYEEKSIYNIEIVVVDSVGHTTTREITIYINDIENESPAIEAEELSIPLPTDNESEYFITTWKTDNIGKSGNKKIIIPVQGDGYNYSVDWGDGTSTKNLTYDATHTYDKAGTYEVKISGQFPYISFGKDYEEEDNLSTDSQKLLSIEQWGDIEWSSMVGSFLNCSNLVINATDKPNLSDVTNISWMFERAISLNQEIGEWDVSNITKMEGTFCHATSFNQDISEWNVSHVTDMSWMFEEAKSFNQDINEWDVSHVTNMSGMFNEALKFNQDISDWDISSVTNTAYMFDDAINFDQDLEGWDSDNIEIMKNMFNDSGMEEIPSWYKE